MVIAPRAQLAGRLVAALLLFLPGTTAQAQETVPDAAAIRERVRAAAAVPDAFRETTVTTSTNGTTTTVKRVQRGASFREIMDVGPFHSERGMAGTQRWHQNDNGQTVLDQAEPGLAVLEAYTTTVTRVHAPVEAYAIATLNAAHDGTTDYVDPASWRLVRRETNNVNGKVTTTYDDVRPDHGRTFAHHWHTDNAYAQTASDTVVTAYEPAEIAAAELAVPPSRRTLVEFPPGVKTVALPTHFGRAHVIVRVDVAGRGLDFVLDTGASGIYIDATVAREMGLPLYGQRSAVTAGRYTTARTLIPEMRVGSLVMRNVAAQTVPQGWNESNGVKSVGLLGFDFLAELGVTIDYEHEQVTVVAGSAFQPPTDPQTTALDVRLGTGQPLASVEINGALGERFVLDTGGAGPFLIYDYFARRHPEALRDANGGGARQRAFTMHGIGGPIETRAYQIASVRIGTVNFRDFVGYRVMSKGAYAGNSDGNIGPDFFRLFTLGLDYAKNRVYLEPNATGRAAMGIR